jgi:N-acetylmuramoyl-L-alanine amidase
MPAPARAVANRSRSSLRERVVVVDAGHGGPDRGMSGPIGVAKKISEKDITLAVARELREALQRRGVRVVMTRMTDTLIALSDRGKIANEARGDLFMSVHVNAANPGWNSPGSARGFETYFLAEAKTEDARRVAAMENESIRFETSVDASRDDPLGFIIRDMAQNEHLRESARLAELVQRGLAGIHPGPNRGVKQAGFRVLINSFMPAVLVEIGFGSNRAESAYMTDPAQQRALAETMAAAAVAYLEQYERKVGNGS